MGGLGVIGYEVPPATGHGPRATCHGPLATCHGPLRGRCHVASGLCNGLRGEKKWPEATKWPEKPAREAISMDFGRNSMIFGIGFSRNFWPEFARFFASKFWPESLIFGPWPEKRKTWKSLESIVKTIVSWHVALCNNGTFSKTHGRKTQRKTPRKNFQNPCRK